MSKSQPSAERIYADRKKAVQDVKRKLLADFNFKKVKCWQDVYTYLGLTQHKAFDSAISLEELNKFIVFLDARVDFKFGLNIDRMATSQLITQLCNSYPALHLLYEQLEPPVVKPPEPAKTALQIVQQEQVVVEQQPIIPEYTVRTVAPGIVFKSKSNKDVVEDKNVDYTTRDYLPKCKKQTCTLREFQVTAAADMFNRFVNLKQPAILHTAPTGYGKTIIIGSLLANLYRLGNFFSLDDMLYTCLYVTRSAAVEQVRRELVLKFGLDIVQHILVVNIEQLRSTAGKLFIKEQTISVNGEPQIEFTWRRSIAPKCIIWDECQSLKNESIQSTIARAFSKLPDVIQVYMSATPFTKVCEAKSLVLAIKLKVTNPITGEDMTITEDSWPQWSANIASDYGRSNVLPSDNSQVAVARLMVHIRPYMVEVKGVRAPFRAINKVEIIHFRTREDKIRYDNAYAEYIKKLAELELNTEFGSFEKMVADQKFQEEAECIRVPELAERAHKSVLAGNSHIVVVNFKRPLILFMQEMTRVYNYSRDDISVIWGGGQSGSRLTAAQRKLMENDKAKKYLAEAGLNIEDFGIDKQQYEKDREWDKNRAEMSSLRLVSQNKQDRQEEIDRFQTGRSKICIFTIRSGGVALSLHHVDEWNGKPVPVERQRTRTVDIVPTYSAIALAQALGRAPRLTSLSDTQQRLLFYGGTVEEEIAVVVGRKLKCLKKVVSIHDVWSEMIHSPKSYVDPTANVDPNAEEESVDDISIDEEDEE